MQVFTLLRLFVALYALVVVVFSNEFCCLWPLMTPMELVVELTGNDDSIKATIKHLSVSLLDVFCGTAASIYVYVWLMSIHVCVCVFMCELVQYLVLRSFTSLMVFTLLHPF